MSRIMRHPAVVQSSNPPQGTGAAPSTITYTILVDWTDPDGQTRTRRIEGVAPNDGRYDDSWTVLPAIPGTAIDVVETPHQLRMMFYGAEKPEPAECGSGTAQQVADLRLTARVQEAVTGAMQRLFGRRA